MHSYTHRTGYFQQQRPGLTLIELMVAVALMVMLIAGIGYVFSSTSKTVRITRNGAEINTATRSLVTQLRKDLRMLDKNGFMAVVGGGVSGARMCPPMLIFTVSGHFDPIRVPEDWEADVLPEGNAEVSTNGAVVMYVPVADSSDRSTTVVSRKRKILARYVFRLAGRNEAIQNGELGHSTADPIYAGPMMMEYAGLSGVDTTAKAMSYDYMPASLDDVAVLPADSAVGGAIDNLFEAFVYPYMVAFTSTASGMGYPVCDVEPVTTDGVDQLWPYLVGGVTSGLDCMAVEFFDGYKADGTDPFDSLPDDEKHLLLDDGGADPADPADVNEDYWLNVIDNISDLRSSARNTSPFCVADTRSVSGVSDIPYVIWSSRKGTPWPSLLKFRLKLTDVAGQRETPAEIELILPVQ